MAKKRATGGGEGGAAAKPKKAAVKKTKAAKPKATKAAKPKATKSAGAGAAKKKAAVKLTEGQKALLTKVHQAGEQGYTPDKKEVRSLEALREKKVVKRGAKNKETGTTPYSVTAVGKKHISTGESAPA